MNIRTILFTLMFGGCFLARNVYAMQEAVLHEVAVQDREADVEPLAQADQEDAQEEMPYEELTRYQKVKYGCFKWRHYTGGISAIGLYSVFSWLFPETSIMVPATVGALGVGAAHFMKNNEAEATAARRIFTDTASIVNREGNRGGLKGLLHEFGKEIFGGGGEGLRENLTDPTIEKIEEKVNELSPKIEEIKAGYEDVKQFLKRSLYALPVLIGVWYAGGILKNQVEAYINRRYLDVTIKRADSAESDGRVARKMIFDEDTSKKLREVFESTRNARIQREPFKNVLLYGPPRSGKRMFANQLALYAHMDYCEIPWTELTKDADGSALDRFFKTDVLKSKNGVVIYIDNAQMLFSSLTDMRNVVLNTLITHTQKQTNQYLVIFGIPEKPLLNNYNSSVIDPYRIIPIVRPAHDERVKILRHYRDEYFDKLSDDVQHVLSEEAITVLARELNGSSAAELAGFMKTLKNDSSLPTAGEFQEVFEELLNRSKRLREDFLASIN